MSEHIRQTLEAVRAGTMSVDDAVLQLKKAPFEDLGYAKVDLHRALRQGAAEVIYGAGKTPEQMAEQLDVKPLSNSQIIDGAGGAELRAGVVRRRGVDQLRGRALRCARGRRRPCPAPWGTP